MSLMPCPCPQSYALRQPGHLRAGAGACPYKGRSPEGGRGGLPLRAITNSYPLSTDHCNLLFSFPQDMAEGEDEFGIAEGEFRLAEFGGQDALAGEQNLIRHFAEG